MKDGIQSGGKAESIASLLGRGSRRLLSGVQRASARLDAELLLAAVLGLRRGQLMARDEETVTAEISGRYDSLLERRAGGTPVAYLTGEREFWSLPLRITPDVLVPRPETETLVECALALSLPADARVLDLGTGSGAIALALASERPGWQLHASDRSPSALAVARDNAARLAPERIRFHEGDWFAALPRGLQFDLVVSNPPYVAPDAPELAALAAEPEIALVAGDDGYAALGAILSEAPAWLVPGGWLLLEHGSGQAAELARRLESGGYAHVRCRTDLAGLDRVTQAQR